MKIYECVGCGRQYGSVENALDCDCGRGEAVSQAEQTANVVQSILNRSESYRQIVKKVEEQIPPELIAAMGLCGWNAFGMFETVLLELKKAKLPICCPHCISGCNACGSKKWLL